MDDDDTCWSLDDLVVGGYELNITPNSNTTQRLVVQYHKKWIGPNVVSSTNLIKWMEDNFGLRVGDYTWQDFELGMDKEHFRASELARFIRHNASSLDVNHMRQLMGDCTRVIYSASNLYTQIACVLTASKSKSVESHYALPLVLQDEDAFLHETENVFTYVDDKLNEFQQLFIHFQTVLRGLGFKRAEGKFFQKIITKSGMETQAFKEVVTVEDFVGRQTTMHANWRAFFLITKPDENYRRLVSYLKERPLFDAPDLKENCHLRSFEGDEYGRGSGIYNCKYDVFFPYIMAGAWDTIAETATRVRRVYAGNTDIYICPPPDPADVCVLHMQNVYPFDSMWELRRLDGMQIGTSWRCAHAFECTSTQHKLECPNLFSALANKLPHISRDIILKPTIGRMWQVVPATVAPFPPPRWVRISNDSVCSMLKADMFSPVICLPETVGDDWLHSNITMESFVKLKCSSGEEGGGEEEGAEYIFFIPCKSPGMRARATVANDMLPSVPISHTSYLSGVHNGETLYFKVDCGMTWLDIETPEIEHIYTCQQFVTSDRFMLFALKGRLFFEVHELDTYEITAMWEGVGGCGKSTIVKAQQHFWPPHLRGILSSNMQAKFGMSAVCKKKVIFCNEVSEELQIVQEEWQSACSGEVQSLSVKFKDAITIRMVAHHMWAGNSFPKKFKNDNMQVSRRLAGVLMANPVQPRDGSIITKIFANAAHLMRKEVLAYFQFVDIHGTTDPMSMPEKLPPAFAAYYINGRRYDPIEDFIRSEKYVVVEEGKTMLMSTFRDLYNRYRIENDLGRAVRWESSCYRTSFNERGVVTRRMSSCMIGGLNHTDVDVIINLTSVEEMDSVE